MSAGPDSPSKPPKRLLARWIMALYLLFLLLPIYWLVIMSFKSNAEILGAFSLFPSDFTLANYRVILTDASWYMGYVNSFIYVSLNTAISLSVALPAAYAFSRYSFVGDNHLFFWLLTNRMAPPAVFALPFFQLYSSIELFDTHIAVALAHCLFNVPLAVWILEGFMRGVIAATMTRTVSASGLDWGVLAAAGVLTIIPGAIVIYFVRGYIAKGFALGRV